MERDSHSYALGRLAARFSGAGLWSLLDLRPQLTASAGQADPDDVSLRRPLSGPRPGLFFDRLEVLFVPEDDEGLIAAAPSVMRQPCRRG